MTVQARGFQQRNRRNLKTTSKLVRVHLLRGLCLSQGPVSEKIYDLEVDHLAGKLSAIYPVV